MAAGALIADKKHKQQQLAKQEPDEDEDMPQAAEVRLSCDLDSDL